MMQSAQKPITQARNHHDYVNCETVERNIKSVNSAPVFSNFREKCDFHPDFLIFMERFMVFLNEQPEYHTLVKNPQVFSNSFSQNLTKTPKNLSNGEENVENSKETPALSIRSTEYLLPRGNLLEKSKNISEEKSGKILENSRTNRSIHSLGFHSSNQMKIRRPKFQNVKNSKILIKNPNNSNFLHNNLASSDEELGEISEFSDNYEDSQSSANYRRNSSNKISKNIRKIERIFSDDSDLSDILELYKCHYKAKKIKRKKISKRNNSESQKHVSFAIENEDIGNNPKRKAESRCEFSDVSEKRDQIGLNSIISELSLNSCSIKSSLEEITNRLNVLEKNSLEIKKKNSEDVNDKNLRGVGDESQIPPNDNVKQSTRNSKPKIANNNKSQTFTKSTNNETNEDKKFIENKKSTEKPEENSEVTLTNSGNSLPENYPTDEENSDRIPNIANENDAEPSDDFKPTDYPINGKYLVNCISSLSSELSKNINLLIKFSLIFPDQFQLPIISVCCENLNKLNINLNQINSNILLFITELSCSTVSESDELFRDRHILCTVSRKSFVENLNKIITKLMKYLIDILTVFQNIEFFHLEFRLMKQINLYLNFYKEILNKKLFDKFYDKNFLENFDYLTQDFIHINFKIKSKINKHAPKIQNLKKNVNSENKSENSNIFDNDKNKNIFKPTESKDTDNLSNNNSLINSNLKLKNFFDVELLTEFKIFFNEKCHKKLNDIIKKSFPKLFNDLNYKNDFDKFHEILFNKLYLIICDKTMKFLLGKSNNLSNLEFSGKHIFAAFLKFSNFITPLASSFLFQAVLSTFNSSFPSLNSATSLFEPLADFFSGPFATSFHSFFCSLIFSTVFSIHHAACPPELLSRLPPPSFFFAFFEQFSNSLQTLVDKKISNIFEIHQHKKSPQQNFIPNLTCKINQILTKSLYGEIFSSFFLKFPNNSQSFLPGSTAEERDLCISTIVNNIVKMQSELQTSDIEWITNQLKMDRNFTKLPNPIREDICNLYSKDSLFQLISTPITKQLTKHCRSFVDCLIGLPLPISKKPTDKESPCNTEERDKVQKPLTQNISNNNHVANNIQINFPSSVSTEQINQLLLMFKSLSQQSTVNSKISLPESEPKNNAEHLETIFILNGPTRNESPSKPKIVSGIENPLSDKPEIVEKEIMKDETTQPESSSVQTTKVDIENQISDPNKSETCKSNEISSPIPEAPSLQTTETDVEKQNLDSNDMGIPETKDNSDIILISDTPPSSPKYHAIETQSTDNITWTGTVEMFDIMNGSGTIKRIDNKPIFFTIMGIYPQSLFLMAVGASVSFTLCDKNDKIRGIVPRAHNIKVIVDELAPPQPICTLKKLDTLSIRRYFSQFVGDALWDSNHINTLVISLNTSVVPFIVKDCDTLTN